MSLAKKCHQYSLFHPLIVFFWLIWVDKCERVIFNLRGHLTIRYAWGIGETVNNEAEVLAIYHGLKLLTTLTKHIVIVIVDWSLIINAIRTKGKNVSPILARLLLWSKYLTQQFNQTQLFHVYRENYLEDNKMENVGAFWLKGCCKKLVWRGPLHESRVCSMKSLIYFFY
jgi:ribonuclease HI